MQQDMQIPKRKSEMNRRREERDDHISQGAADRIQRTIENIERSERPRTVEELTRAREMGDLSENAAYSEAKGRLARLDSKLFGLKERLKHAVIIRPGADAYGAARIGSKVSVEVNGKRKIYEIVGSLETDPSGGRISHQSPLGQALLGAKPDASVTVTAASGKEVEYRIVDVF